MAKTKQSTLIVSVKLLSIGFINKYIYKLRKEGDYSVLVNYQLLLPNMFPLDLPQIIFLHKL